MKKRETLYCDYCGKEVNIGDWYFLDERWEDTFVCEECGEQVMEHVRDDLYRDINTDYDSNLFKLTQNGRLLDEAMEEDLTEELAWFLGDKYILIKYNPTTGDHHIRVFNEDKSLDQFSIVFTIRDESEYEQVSYDISILTEEMTKHIKRYTKLDVRSMADTRANNKLFDRD
mgnify:CR=1 FL=1